MSLKQHIPNTLTCLNLFCGALGVVFALEGRIDVAFPLMLAGAVFDFSDGLAARLLGAYSPKGKELDSLSDMISFGLLPSVMLYETMRLAGCHCVLAYVTLFLAVMSGLRLAKFNIDERQGTDFIGVATPTAALLAGSLSYFIFVSPASPLTTWLATSWFLAALAVVLGLLLVSEIPMFGIKIAKGQRLLDTKRIILLILVLAAAVFTLVFSLNWSLFILLSFSAYLIENLIIAFLGLFRK